jgi:hypothetical protein
MPTSDTTVLFKALQFAACKHGTQRRKDVGRSCPPQKFSRGIESTILKSQLR